MSYNINWEGNLGVKFDGYHHERRDVDHNFFGIVGFVCMA